MKKQKKMIIRFGRKIVSSKWWPAFYEHTVYELKCSSNLNYSSNSRERKVHHKSLTMKHFALKYLRKKWWEDNRPAGDHTGATRRYHTAVKREALENVAPKKATRTYGRLFSSFTRGRAKGQSPLRRRTLIFLWSKKIIISFNVLMMTNM